LKSAQTRDIRQSVTIYLQNTLIVPTTTAFNLLHTAPLSGNPDPIAGHNKNEFP
jgi:hypothetical protein